jgi:hypothetical protein
MSDVATLLFVHFNFIIQLRNMKALIILDSSSAMTLIMYILRSISGADPGFQVRGVNLKKLSRAEGGTNIFGIFRVKNHDFMPKDHKIIFMGNYKV